MTFWVAGAAVVGAIGGAVISSKSAKKAADKQAESSQSALDETARQYDQSREDLAPYRKVGETALWNLEKENNSPLDLGAVQLDPGYEFARKQGQQGIDRQTSAAGGRISGAALKAASQYNTDYANSGYSTAYARANQARTDRLNRLAALAGVGQTATNNVTALGANAAANNSQMLINQGNNAGAAAIAQGNIWGNTTNQLAAVAGKYANGGYTPPPRAGSTGGDGGEYMNMWKNGG